MSRNVTVTLVFAATVSAYFLGGFATQLIGGVLPTEDFFVPIVGGIVLLIAVLTALFDFSVGFIAKKIGSPDRPMALGNLGKGLITTVVVAALAVGVTVSYPKVQEKKSTEARLKAIAEVRKNANAAEEKRVALLTPEQRALEGMQREAQRAEAAKNAAVAKAVEDAKKEVQAKKEAERNAARELSLAGANMLKKSMKDPDSFELKDVALMESGSFCYTYRARNSFNAMLQSNAVLVKSGGKISMSVEGQNGNKFVTDWNKHCAQKAGDDVTSWVKRLMN